MGYRGEGYASSGYDGRGDSYDDSYGQDDGQENGDYPTGAYSTGSWVEGGYGTGPIATKGSGRTGQEDSRGPHDSGAYYSAPPAGSYDGSAWGSASHDGGSYRTASSDDSGPYRRPSYVSGGYPTLGHPSGGYPAQNGHPNGTGALPDPYADGNDWYADQSGARQTGFADTSAQLAVRDPIRGYPPEPAHPDTSRGYSGPQRRYDEGEYVTYPGYEGVDRDSPAYGARHGYDYDDYAQTRLDQPAVDYGAPGGYDRGAGPAPARGFGQGLQGDDFDGGVYHDSYEGDPDMLSGPGGGTGPQRGLASREQARNAVFQDPPRTGGRRRGRAVVLTAVGLVVIAAAGFGGYKYLYLPKHKADNSAAAGTNESLPSSAPSAAMSQCVAQYGQFCHIQSRVLDPAPLTLDELYPPAFFNTSDNTNFARVATREDKDCSKPIIGSELQSQLKKGGCNQVLRGSYISGDNKIMGTIGVINLASTNQAHYAGKIIGGSNFIMPLATSKGLTSKLGQGKGVVEAQYRGHYLIVTWAEFTNGTAPTTPALMQQLETFEGDLIQGTANIIISQRMINGDTPVTAPSASASAPASASARSSASASSSASSSATG